MSALLNWRLPHIKCVCADKNGQRINAFDFLIPNCSKEHFDVCIEGDHLVVVVEINNVLLNPKRLERTGGGLVDASHTKSTALRSKKEEVHKKKGITKESDETKSIQKCKLDFPCEKDLCLGEDGKGERFRIDLFQHPRKICEQKQDLRQFVLSAECADANKPRAVVKDNKDAETEDHGDSDSDSEDDTGNDDMNDDDL